MGDGFGIISTEYESRLDIAAQQELRPPIPNPNDKTDRDSRCQTNLQGNLRLSKNTLPYIQRGGKAEMRMAEVNSQQSIVIRIWGSFSKKHLTRQYNLCIIESSKFSIVISPSHLI
jgi:hypothetical protein